MSAIRVMENGKPAWRVVDTGAVARPQARGKVSGWLVAPTVTPVSLGEVQDEREHAAHRGKR